MTTPTNPAAPPTAGEQASATALNDNALASGETGSPVVAAVKPQAAAPVSSGGQIPEPELGSGARPAVAATPKAATQAPQPADHGQGAGMEVAATTPAVAAPKPPMSAEALVDLRRRVLANEPVSDDELRHALSSLAMARGTAPTGAKAATAVYEAKGSIADRFAAFKAKTKQTDAAGSVVVEEKKPDGNG